jgi:hypothetical protein
MPALLSDLARTASPHVVAACIIALVAAYLALVVVLVVAAIVALFTKDESRRKSALAVVRLLRWRGWGWHRDDGG